MNNEIQRKLTSLTLMTIMLAGGMAAAVPSMVPEAAAAGQLFVSAENANFNNYFAGVQVVEIIVKDPNANKTNEAQPEPTVKVDEHALRMAQGTDGYWYAYIADSTNVTTAWNENIVADNHIHFGYLDDDAAGEPSTGFPAIATPADVATYFQSSSIVANAPTLSAVIQSTGAISTGTATDLIGQVGIKAGDWPIIQTYDFTIETFEIKLEQPGTDEIVTLTHGNSDIDDYAGIKLDRSAATNGAHVHLTITDQALNIDPTSEDVVLFNVTSGSEGVSFKESASYSVTGYKAFNNSFDDNGKLKINYNAQGATNDVLVNTINDDDLIADKYLIFWETAENSGVFVNTDDDDDSNLTVKTGTSATKAARGTTATIDYNDSAQSFMVAHSFATIDMDVTSVGDEWNSGEEMTIVLYDQDLNLNTMKDEDLSLSGGTLVPSIQIGSPLMMLSSGDLEDKAVTVTLFSNIGVATVADTDGTVTIDTGIAIADLATFVGTTGVEHVLFNYDIKSLSTVLATAVVITDETATNPVNLSANSAAIALTNTVNSGQVEVNIDASAATAGSATKDSSTDMTAAADVTITTSPTGSGFTTGEILITGATSGATATVLFTDTDANGTITEAELDTALGLTITSAGTFTAGEALTLTQPLTGTVNLSFTGTTNAVAVGDQFAVDFMSFGGAVNNAIYRIELEETGDNTGAFAGSAEYVMLNQLNVDQAATYNAVNAIQDDVNMIVHVDMTDEDSIRVNYLDLGADGVSTQISDQQEAPTHSGTADLDMDSYKIADTVIVTINDQDLNTDSELLDVYLTKADQKVGDNSGDHIMDITFDDEIWTTNTLGACTGTVTGDEGLQASGFTLVETAVDSGLFTGSFQVPTNFCHSGSDTIVSVTGTDIEVNYNDFRDNSGNTIEVGDGASITANTGSVTFDRSVYPVPYAASTFKEHSTSNGGTVQYLPVGSVVVHVRVSDADYDTSATGQDSISSSVLDVKISRGSLESANLASTTATILETAPGSGIFEYDLTIASGALASSGDFASTDIVNQGDIITVTYTDPQDASGKIQTVTDSSSFDLRNGTLQADKSVYLIGSDMILTLIEPDFDLDNDETESYTLDLIEWDSDAATTSMGPSGLTGVVAAFDAEPSTFRETGDSTGIFQVVIEIPQTLNSQSLDRGEKIDLEYTDWGPAGADYVGQEDEDIGLTVYTSNFGATIELDQKVYTWTDKVYITIVAPDHNMDSGLVDEIGNTSTDPIKISTRGSDLSQYKLVESGPDTGIFIGEVTLTGFLHDADGVAGNDTVPTNSGANGGPTDGKITTSDNDGLTVSFEFSEDETVVGSALIRWNIGEVQWLESSYPASGTGVVRVIDADMNLNPEQVDNFKIDAWSDSDAGGIDLTVTETNEATGIFEGTVFFTVSNDSSGSRLRVAEGDTVTAEYEDNTLPDPYTTADELDIAATTLIGTIVPPLERAPAANLRTVDAFGNSLNSVSVDQQVQISADLANGQDKEQSFAYLVQIQDGDGVTVSLAWITGSLSSGQSFSPALSWIPTTAGTYTATAFVWESVDNPTALSPPVSTSITVQ